MDVRASDHDFSQLFAHQEWVRALALRLCGDHAAADDLVQDTWVEALRGNSRAHSVRSWLGGIVRHRWRRDRLRSSARVDREASVARSPEMPSPEGLLAQAELQRRVLAAVASLEESSRTVVLMRYYEGLSSEAIAERLHEPASTIRNRLSRAHQKLSSKLDREYGDSTWSTLFAPTAFHPVGSLHASLGAAMKTKLVVAIVLVTGGTTWLWLGSRARSTPPVDRSSALARDGGTDPAASATRSLSSIAAVSGQRSLVPDVATAGDPLLLYGSLVGATAEEVSNASLSLIFADGSSAPISAGPNATYSAFGLRPGPVHLCVWIDGFVPKEDAFVLSAGTGQVRHDVKLDHAFVLPVKFVDPTTQKPTTSPTDFRGPKLTAIATRERPRRVEGILLLSSEGTGDAGRYRRGSGFSGSDGVAPGYAGMIEIQSPLPVWVSCVLRDTVLDSRLVHGDEKDVVFNISAADLDAALGSLRLRCVDDKTRAPVAGAAVRSGFVDAGQQSGTSDENGSVSLSKLPPGLQRVVITAPDMGMTSRVVRVRPGEMSDLGTIELGPAASIAGHVTDADGQIVEGSVCVLPLRQPFTPSGAEPLMYYSCGAGGAFKIDELERGPCRIVVQAKGYALHVIDADTSRDGLGALDIKMERGTLVRFRATEGTLTGVHCLLADAAGIPIRTLGVSRFGASELMLAPGQYQCWTIADDRIVRKASLAVGTMPLLHEVQAP